jgi:hypothetical protein
MEAAGGAVSLPRTDMILEQTHFEEIALSASELDVLG